MTDQQPDEIKTITHPTKGLVQYTDNDWTNPGDSDVAVAQVTRTNPDGAIENFWLLTNTGAESDGTILLFDQGEWDAFVAGARNGEFDPATFDAADATITSGEENEQTVTARDGDNYTITTNPNDESHETITVTET